MVVVVTLPAVAAALGDAAMCGSPSNNNNLSLFHSPVLL